MDRDSRTGNSANSAFVFLHHPSPSFGTKILLRRRVSSSPRLSSNELWVRQFNQKESEKKQTGEKMVDKQRREAAVPVSCHHKSCIQSKKRMEETRTKGF